MLVKVRTGSTAKGSWGEPGRVGGLHLLPERMRMDPPPQPMPAWEPCLKAFQGHEATKPKKAGECLTSRLSLPLCKMGGSGHCCPLGCLWEGFCEAGG